MPFTPFFATPSLVLSERIVTTSGEVLVGDGNNLITVNAGGAVTLTIPTHATTPIPVGSQVLVFRLGGGAVSISPASGVTLNAVSFTLRAQFSFATLVKRGENLWALGGDLT